MGHDSHVLQKSDFSFKKKTVRAVFPNESV